MMEGTDAKPYSPELPEKQQQSAERELKPWEQHASVISIPRFDYKAAASLLERPRSGFLITCPIKREKSATKEAITILEKHLECKRSYVHKGSESSESQDPKKRKILSNSEYESMFQNGSSTCNISDNSNLPKGVDLSLIKLKKNGLLLFTFPETNCNYPVSVLSSIFQSLESGAMKRPQWCHRVFPIQETCVLNAGNLHTVVSKLVAAYVNDTSRNLERPIKFAVGYNRRGLDETTDQKLAKAIDTEINDVNLLGRDDCFKAVAKAVKNIAEDVIVDLKQPELIVLIELLPLSGVPNNSIVAGVSILPADLVSTKPKLSVKALSS